MIRKSPLAFLLLFTPLALLAQQEVRGKVMDAYSGEALQGVSVGPDSTRILANTDANGRFSLKMPEEASTLRFYHVGYRTRTVRPDTSGFLRIGLEEEPRSMNEVVVTGFGTDDRLKETAGSAARLDRQDLERYHDASLRPALNTVPGVRMDSRGIGGSSRISIRGSELRSPWGVRNLKAYWNGMPLTSPDGSTPLEVIDPKAVGNVEILKGPSGSLYGAGNGGVMKFQSQQTAYGERFVQAEGMVGQYGMQRQSASAGVGTEKMRVHLHYGRVRNDGYREQEFVNRDHIRLNSSFYLDEKNRIDLFGYYFDGGWGLPGGLSREEFQEDPRQAVPFSVEGNASFEHRTGRLGARHTHRFSEGLEHSLTLYTGHGNKENPYGTSPFYHGYKIENAQGGGYRNELRWEEELGEEVSMKLILGSEGQSEINSLRNFDNEEGEPGDIRENSNTRSRVGLFFLQNHWYLPFDITATVGVSYNRVEYRHRDFHRTDSIDFSNTFEFSPGWVPRFSLVKGLGEDWAVHGSVSEGFSAPTVWELIKPDGSINTGLNAETGRNYEAGVRGQLLDGRIGLDVTGYWFRLRDAILPEEQIGNQAVYANLGRTEQQGLEASLDLRIHRDRRGWLREANLRQTYAYQHFVFGEYVEEGQDFQGERIPGVPQQNWTQMLTLRTAPGLYLEATGRFVGDAPLDNANSAFMEAYYVLEGKLGLRRSLSENFRLHLFGGVQNILDTQYSAFLQVNNVSEAYFNPAPGRMFYGGVGLRYGF